MGGRLDHQFPRDRPQTSDADPIGDRRRWNWTLWRATRANTHRSPAHPPRGDDARDGDDGGLRREAWTMVRPRRGPRQATDSMVCEQFQTLSVKRTTAARLHFRVATPHHLPPIL